jgi:hypothetical protein
MSLSLTQLYARARAGATYRALRPLAGPQLCEIRRALTYSHFAAMGELMRKYEFSAHEAIEQLRTAAENGVSVQSMRYYISGEHESAANEARQRRVRILDQLEKHQSDYGLTEHEREMVRIARLLLRTDVAN